MSKGKDEIIVDEIIKLFRNAELTIDEAEKASSRLTQAIQFIKQNNRI